MVTSRSSVSRVTAWSTKTIPGRVVSNTTKSVVTGSVKTVNNIMIDKIKEVETGYGVP